MANPKTILGYVPMASIALTVNTTISQTHFGKTLTNRGASGATTHTLPNPTAVMDGAFFDWRGVADQDVTFQTSTADTMITIGDNAADSIALITAGNRIGSWITFYCDGTSWFASQVLGIAVITT